VQKQQVVPENAESYFSFFRAPLTAYQKVIEVVETASKQSLDVSHSQYNAPYFSVFP